MTADRTTAEESQGGRRTPPKYFEPGQLPADWISTVGKHDKVRSNKRTNNFKCPPRFSLSPRHGREQRCRTLSALVEEVILLGNSTKIFPRASSSRSPHRIQNQLVSRFRCFFLRSTPSIMRPDAIPNEIVIEKGCMICHFGA